MWGDNFIRLPLTWLGADVYLDQSDNTLCYEADGQHLVELKTKKASALMVFEHKPFTPEKDENDTSTTELRS